MATLVGSLKYIQDRLATNSFAAHKFAGSYTILRS